MKLTSKFGKHLQWALHKMDVGVELKPSLDYNVRLLNTIEPPPHSTTHPALIPNTQLFCESASENLFCTTPREVEQTQLPASGSPATLDRCSEA